MSVKNNKSAYERDWLENLDFAQLKQLINSDKTYKYREFCKLINIPICNSGSNSQIRQLNQLAMICEYEKTNHKYNFIALRTPDEIYFYDQRALYVPLIELCLSEKFLEFQHQENNINYQNGVLFFSLNTVIQWCGITHSNFQTAQYANHKNKQIICLKHNYNIKNLEYFINISYNKLLKPLMRSALKTLDNRGSIVIHKGYKIFNVSPNGYISYRNVLANGLLGQELNQIIAQVYTEFNIKKAQELFFISNSKREDFLNRCNQLCQEKYGFTGFYDCYAITVNWNRARYNLTVLQKELNQRIIQKFQQTSLFKNLDKDLTENFIYGLINIDTPLNFKEDLIEYSQYQLS